ncbi:RNA polymerase sigma factor [Piscinibacter terrae]|uniref:Sigma-70 family RNA polymerase sigma factor n=1 Tax=Piscinibacter terrae TaxID=2496871 RepID=A0A3N7HRI4_9BURK|nr:sigma-70 family RNA polymerase sigma factor [Albitalea terrae]RQP24804.1 sigma-70 family RNA polymerase sigma factor [Albitalea terrae]
MPTPASPDRSDLLARARDGDRTALESLLRDCMPDLRRYARRHCPAHEVDDAVQDALWIMSRRVGDVRAAQALSSWLFQVVRRLCIRVLALHRPTETLDAQAPELAQDDDEVRALRIDLARALSAMAPIYRETLMQVDVLGHTLEEAAHAQDITVDAAKSRLHRARRMLREHMHAQPQAA